MFNRQFSSIAIAILLLSPNLVRADEIDGDPNLSVGNVRILSTKIETIVKTPKIQINTPKVTDDRVLISRTRRRYRIPVMRHIRISTPSILNKKISSDRQTTITTNTSSVNGSTTHSSTIRSSSTGSQSINQQQQSIQCSSSSDSVVSQSTSTINGRTVSSEVRTNCN